MSAQNEEPRSLSTSAQAPAPASTPLPPTPQQRKTSRQLCALARAAFTSFALIFLICWEASPYWLTLMPNEVAHYFVPEVDGFFEQARLTPTELCMTYTHAVPRDSAPVAQNFTMLGGRTPLHMQLLKAELCQSTYVQAQLELREEPEFLERARRRTFALWVCSEWSEFHAARARWLAADAGREPEPDMPMPAEQQPPQQWQLDTNEHMIALDPRNIEQLVRDPPVGTMSFQGTMSDGSRSPLYVAPDELVNVLFGVWYNEPGIIELVYAYWQALELPDFVTDRRGHYLYLLPSTPMQDRHAHNYDYVTQTTCQPLIEVRACGNYGWAIIITGLLAMACALLAVLAIFVKDFGQRLSRCTWLPSVLLASSALCTVAAIGYVIFFTACVIPESVGHIHLIYNYGSRSIVLAPLALILLVIVLIAEISCTRSFSKNAPLKSADIKLADLTARSNTYWV